MDFGIFTLFFYKLYNIVEQYHNNIIKIKEVINLIQIKRDFYFPGNFLKIRIRITSFDGCCGRVFS